MSASDFSEVGLSRDQRILLLRLACASDRLELGLLAKAPAPSLTSRILSGVHAGHWLQLGSGLVMPFLPRKLRLLMTVARVWRRARSRQSEN